MFKHLIFFYFLISLLSSCSIKPTYSAYIQSKGGYTYYRNPMLNLSLKYPGDYDLQVDSLKWKYFATSNRTKRKLKKNIRKGNADVLFIGETTISPYYKTIGVIYYNSLKNKSILQKDKSITEFLITDFKNEYATEKIIEKGGNTIYFFTVINKLSGYTEDDFFGDTDAVRQEKNKRDIMMLEMDGVLKSITPYEK